MDKPQELLIATFNDKKSADEAHKELKKWSHNHDIKVLNAAVIEKDDKGKASIHQDQDVSAGTGTLFGAVVGGVVGLVGGPAGVVAGAAAGAVTGGATAAAVNFGFSDDELKAIRNSLPASSSALVTLVEDRYVEDMTSELNRRSPHVWHRALPADYVRTVDKTYTK